MTARIVLENSEQDLPLSQVHQETIYESDRVIIPLTASS